MNLGMTPEYLHLRGDSMRNIRHFSTRSKAVQAGLAVLVFSLASPLGAQEIATRTADVGGVKIQYLTAGRGPAVLLLHGYAETSRMWRPLIPRLAAEFTVIAPDLPGIGDSDIPADGLDMSHAATRIHALIAS